jgi:hypothetical protein
MSLGASPGLQILRSRIPVLDTIHSWEVSIRAASSWFVTVVVGTYAPMPLIRIPVAIGVSWSMLLNGLFAYGRDHVEPARPAKG